MKRTSILILFIFVFSGTAYGAWDALHKTSLRVPIMEKSRVTGVLPAWNGNGWANGNGKLRIIPRQDDRGEFESLLPASYAGENPSIADLIGLAVEFHEKGKKSQDPESKRNAILLAGDFAIQALSKIVKDREFRDVSVLVPILNDFEKEAYDESGVTKAMAGFLKDNSVITWENIDKLEKRLGDMKDMNNRTTRAINSITDTKGRQNLFNPAQSLISLLDTLKKEKPELFNKPDVEDFSVISEEIFIKHLRPLYDLVLWRIYCREKGRYDSNLPVLSISEGAMFRKCLDEIASWQKNEDFQNIWAASEKIKDAYLSIELVIKDLKRLIEKGTGKKAILPLQASLYGTAFSKSIITDPEQIKRMIEKVHRDKLDGGYEPGSIIERAYSLDAINLTNCFVFEALRLRVICFEANSVLAKIAGYVQPGDRDYDQEFFDKAYMLSIENKEQEIVGHGILAYNSDIPGTVLFRYSIHGSTHIAHKHDFSRKGYGVEALLLMMIIANRGEVFPEDINKLEYLLMEEDYANSFGHLQREPNKDFYAMRNFLLKAGFVDETQFDLGRKHPSKYPVILYYMSKPQPMDIEKLAQLVINRLLKQDYYRFGDSFLKIFTTADIREYTYPVALEAGMVIPEGMDWQAFANLVWHEYYKMNNISPGSIEPFSINGVYFGEDLRRDL